MVQRTPPQVLYEVPNINVFHLASGSETPLNERPAPLTLLMVSTTIVDPFEENPTEEEDFYLHIQQLPNLDLPLPATTKIFRQYPRSYLIPRLDLDGGQGNCFTRIEFSEKRNQDDVDTFETILAQCTAFLENAKPPELERSRSRSPLPSYGPPTGSNSDYYHASEKKSPSSSRSREKAGASTRDFGGASASGYVPGSGVMANQQYNPSNNYGAPTMSGPEFNPGQGGRLVLVDEQDGRIVGELSEGFNVVESQGIQAGSKSPVEVSLPTHPGSHDLIIKPVGPINHADIFGAAEHPAYAGSTIVSKAAWASKFIVTAATYAATAMESGATKFTQKTNPVAEPLTFTPTTHDRVRKIHTFTHGASGFSSKTIGKVQEVAQNIGAKVAGKVDRDGNEIDKKVPTKPGLLNKSMIAFSTLADGIDAAGKHLLGAGSNAATTVVKHRYGDEAGHVAYGVTSSVKNVGLVYVDAAGVSRRAVVKSVAKGMVLGKVKGGGELVAASGDGMHANVMYPSEKNESQQTLWVPQGSVAGGSRPASPQPYPLQHSATAPPVYTPQQHAPQNPNDGGSWGGFNRANSHQGPPPQQKPNDNWF
ncbi:Spartin [Dactylellina cionopaga]|nr:Spartin [Dactylellina cionopaga]